MNSFLSRLLPGNVCLPYPTGTTLSAFIFVYDIEESSGEMPSLTLIPGEYNWGEPERAPHRRYSWEITYIIIIMVRPSSTRRGWSHEVCRASVTRKSIYCPKSLVLPDGFGVSLAFVVV